MAKWGTLPVPEEAMVTRFCLATAMNSCGLLAGWLGCTTSISTLLTTSDTAARSRTGS